MPADPIFSVLVQNRGCERKTPKWLGLTPQTHPSYPKPRAFDILLFLGSEFVGGKKEALAFTLRFRRIPPQKFALRSTSLARPPTAGPF